MRIGVAKEIKPDEMIDIANLWVEAAMTLVMSAGLAKPGGNAAADQQRRQELVSDVRPRPAADAPAMASANAIRQPDACIGRLPGASGRAGFLRRRPWSQRPELPGVVWALWLLKISA